MMKFLRSLVALTFMLSLTVVSYGEVYYGIDFNQFTEDSHVYSIGDYLTASEIEEIDKALASLEKKHDVAVNYIILDKNNINIPDLSMAIYNYSAVGKAKNEDVIMAVVGMSSIPGDSYVDIFTYGEGNDIVNNSILDEYLDDQVYYLSDDNYYNAAVSFVNNSNDCLSSYGFRSAMAWVITVVIGIVLGIAATGAAYYRVYKLHVPVAPAKDGKHYLKGDGFKLSRSDDVYITTRITKTPRAKSSSGGGGGGGGGGRGGGGRSF